MRIFILGIVYFEGSFSKRHSFSKKNDDSNFELKLDRYTVRSRIIRFFKGTCFLKHQVSARNSTHDLTSKSGSDMEDIDLKTPYLKQEDSNIQIILSSISFNISRLIIYGRERICIIFFLLTLKISSLTC